SRREELQRLNIQGNEKELDAARAQVAELQAVLSAEQTKLEELKLNDPGLSVRRAEAELRAKQGALDRARLVLSECDIKAPADGTILRVLVTRGETLGSQPRQPAVLFCPHAPRIVRAEVEQESAGWVAVGQAAAMEDDASGGSRWTGKITRLSDWYTQRRSILQEPLQLNDVRTLECIITLDPNQPPLR